MRTKVIISWQGNIQNMAQGLRAECVRFVVGDNAVTQREGTSKRKTVTILLVCLLNSVLALIRESDQYCC